eukprot:CAMPEP_0204396042 /NCGR_PEP_ID=MMETSP0470-20130426/1080_1 /ASSEMBLY_ACC=CAM_ASM_000385 /TAXON_ID=2969 /ORGANISM="Oxyrrhis marina" /LENGTH=46 /DNA_ID= /DNA_START= /DNA_END= /DNA_ORIENTATION=
MPARGYTTGSPIWLLYAIAASVGILAINRIAQISRSSGLDQSKLSW